MCLKIDKDKVRMEYFKKFQTNILKVLDHPDIIKVFDCLTIDNENKI